VKEEDADWLIYHLVVQNDAATGEELVTQSGIDAPTVNASLDRLIRYLLIEHSGGKFRALSIPEALLKCQIKNSCDSEFTIVDGIIKARKL